MADLEYAPSEAFLFFSPPSRDAWFKKITVSDTAGSLSPVREVCVVRTVRGLSSFVRVLSETGNALEAAANLFDLLHELDSLGPSRIRAEMAPPEGLGLAINDRLSRASKKQP
jgi:L-threonylcarbamoyladenylate synthase